MFVAPYAQRSEYSGKFYHNILLEALLERAISNPQIIQTQQEVDPQVLEKAARYTYLQRCEQAGIPKFLNAEERAELFKLGCDIADKLVAFPKTPMCSISLSSILDYLKNYAVKTYDWPEPRFSK